MFDITSSHIFLLPYIRLKIKVLSEKIAESQRALRQFSKDHYMSLGYPPEISEDMSQCCVSQRDIQVCRLEGKNHKNKGI